MATKRERPGWLVTERVMGDAGLKPTDWAGYEAYMEGRVLELRMKEGRRELNEEWKRIRRGWYLGGEGFRGRMLKSLKQAMGKGLAGSYGGEAKREHGEAEAERILTQGMEGLKVKEEDLVRGPKNMAEKQVLAWWLRQRTTVRRRWMSEHLWMGEESGVTRAVRMVKGNEDATLKRLRRQLLKCLPNATT